MRSFFLPQHKLLTCLPLLLLPLSYSRLLVFTFLLAPTYLFMPACFHLIAILACLLPPNCSCHRRLFPPCLFSLACSCLPIFACPLLPLLPFFYLLSPSLLACFCLFSFTSAIVVCLFLFVFPYFYHHRLPTHAYFHHCRLPTFLTLTYFCHFLFLGTLPTFAYFATCAYIFVCMFELQVHPLYLILPPFFLCERSGT